MMGRYFPILNWGSSYSTEIALRDLVAAIIVTLMLVPQSLAYALLAGLPAEYGLYASIVPLLAYAIFGTSTSLSVGPVAVVSLMTAASLAKLNLPAPLEYAAAAALLAAMSGIILLLLGIFRLGFFANFLSYPVISGFITASAILIAVGQFKHLLGIPAAGENALELLQALLRGIGQTNVITAGIGVANLATLFWLRYGVTSQLVRLGFKSSAVDILVKTGPILVLAASAFFAWLFAISDQGVKLVGHITPGLPHFALHSFSIELVKSLALPALLISVVGFIESVSVGQTLAAKRRQRIDPDQELIGLGAANLGAAVSGGFPVTGGFARSVVNFDAGAATPAAGAFTALGLGLTALYFTPALSYLPQATLAATIIVAVASLIDFSILKRSWSYAFSDLVAVVVTIALTLFVGVEAGIIAGVLLSICLHLYRTSRPHIAILGRVPGTEHFRNIKRHSVETDKTIVSMRVDESLYFANARFLEDEVYAQIAAQPLVQHLVLVCSAINDIDLSAVNTMECINARLKDADVTFHLSEVKGPVMDKLQRSGFLTHLTGKIFLSHHQAISEISSNPTP